MKLGFGGAGGGTFIFVLICVHMSSTWKKHILDFIFLFFPWWKVDWWYGLAFYNYTWGHKFFCRGPTSFEHQMAEPLTPPLHNRFARSEFWGKSWCGANTVDRGGGDPENYKEEWQFFIKECKWCNKLLMWVLRLNRTSRPPQPTQPPKNDTSSSQIHSPKHWTQKKHKKFLA